MPQIQPPATRFAHHTAASMKAANDLRRDILAAARMPADAAGPTLPKRWDALTVRNRTWTRPFEPTTPAVGHAARRADAPMHRAPTGRLDYKPECQGLVDDSWKRFVNHLQTEGRVPGAMQGDPDAGVLRSRNVRPRAVTAFLRQSMTIPAALPFKPSAAVPAVDAFAHPVSLPLKEASPTASFSEDEGIGLGSPGRALRRSASEITVQAGNLDESGFPVSTETKAKRDVSDDEGFGPSRPASPALSDDDSPLFDHRPFRFDVPHSQPFAWNADVIRDVTGFPTPPDAAAPLGENAAEPLEPMVSAAFVQPTDIKDFLIDHTGLSDFFLDYAKTFERARRDFGGIDPWAPQPIVSARPVNDIRDWSFLDFSEVGSEVELHPVVTEPADIPREQDVIEETAQTVFIGTPRTASERQLYLRQHDESLRRGNEQLITGAFDGLWMIDGEYEKPSSKVSFSEDELVAHVRPVTDGDGDREEVRLAYVRAKSGPGTRSELGADYHEDPSNSAPWFRSTALRGVVRRLPPEISGAVTGPLRGILNPASPLVSTPPRPPADMYTSDDEASDWPVHARTYEVSSSPVPRDLPVIPEVDYSDDEAGVYF